MSNKMAFVKVEFNGWVNEIVPTCSEPHGTKWPGFDRVEVVNAVLLRMTATKQFVLGYLV